MMVGVSSGSFAIMLGFRDNLPHKIITEFSLIEAPKSVNPDVCPQIPDRGDRFSDALCQLESKKDLRMTPREVGTRRQSNHLHPIVITLNSPYHY